MKKNLSPLFIGPNKLRDMKKYIFFSLLLHIGVGAFLISWSGISISQWYQNLPYNFGIKHITDETTQIQENFSEEEVVKKQALNKAPIKKEKKKKPAIVQKSKTQVAPVIKKPKKSTIDNESIRQTVSSLEGKKVENSKVAKTEDTPQQKAQTESINNQQDIQKIPQETKPEVNPAEDLTAMRQESSENPEPLQEKEDQTSEISSDHQKETQLTEDKTSPSISNRNFETINTDPQELTNTLKTPPPQQKELKSGEKLLPVPGNPKWVYPKQARNNKNEGSVFLQYFVDDTGFVDQIQLLKSSGYSILDNEALRVMARQRYQPGQAGWYRHRVDFKLKNM